MESAQSIISRLNLEPLEEGGYFKRIYESSEMDSQGRRYGAAIYYLLEAPDYSCFHRLDCEELWHFYAGNPLLIHQIDANGQLTESRLGNPLHHPQASPVVTIPKGVWFAAEIANHQGFSFVGCTTTPEFLYQHYEIETAETLCNLFPKHTEIIKRLGKHHSS